MFQNAQVLHKRELKNNARSINKYKTERAKTPITKTTSNKNNITAGFLHIFNIFIVIYLLTKNNQIPTATETLPFNPRYRDSLGLNSMTREQKFCKNALDSVITIFNFLCETSHCFLLGNYQRKKENNPFQATTNRKVVLIQLDSDTTTVIHPLVASSFNSHV